MEALGQGLSLLLLAAAFCGCLYQIVSAVLVRRFMARPVVPPSHRPPVTVMKPLCGAEPGMAENLSSCLAQDYPAFQTVFGVQAPSDPARALAEKLANGQGRVAVVVDSTPHGRNLKVANLLNMWPAVTGDVVVIADSDIRVTPDYLDQGVAPLAHPKVGVVTFLYVGRPAEGLWSAQGALGINHGFLPSALLARAIGRKDGCFGATMVVRRTVLEKAGGLAALADVLADDWVLGRLARDQGLEIAIAARPVDIVVHEPGFKALLAHEVRWARTVAAIDRVGYQASVITQPVALAVLALAFGGAGPLALGGLVLAALCRLWAVRVEEAALSLPKTPPGQLVLREFLSLLVYVVASLGRTVIWRGRKFIVRRDGTLDQA